MRLVFWTMFAGITISLLMGFFWVDELWPRVVVNNRVIGELPAVQDKPSERTLMSLPRACSRRTAMPAGAGLGWPTLLGPRHDGTSPEMGLDLEWPEEGPLEKWRIAVGAGYAGPVALGDVVVLLHRKGQREVVECFEPESGQTRWEHSWGAIYECPYNHSSGPYAAPVLEAGRVYAIGAGGDLYCLDLESGAEIWRRSLHEDYEVEIEVWPVSASPLIVGDRLIVNIGGRKTGAGVVALSKETGETLWTATEDGASCATPRSAVMHGRTFVFVWTADALVSLDPEDGNVYWRIPFCAKNYEAAHGTTPLVTADVVFVSGYQTGNLCVRVSPDGACQELWRDKGKLLDSQYNNLLYVDGDVVGFSITRKSLRRLDLATGELKWQWRSKALNGTMIAVDGHYLLFGEKGHLASLVFDEEGARAVSMTRRPVLAPPCLSYPALHNGLLYVRNEEEMVCIDLRREEG